MASPAASLSAPDLAAAAEFRPLDRSIHELLVVNDDPAIRYATARLLRSAGFKTREAATGAEGLALADTDISAMVLDVHLPDIDGFELCRLLRSRASTARLPVLHLTAAYVKDEDKVRGLDSGADAYLTHPVEPAVLVATVQALVRTRVAEEAMRHSEAKFKALYAQAPNGIGLLDEEGRFTDANPSMLKLLDRSLGEVVGRPLTDFVAPEQTAQARELLDSASASVVNSEFPVLTGAGREVTIGWALSPQVQPGVNMLLATDQSARALLEQERQKALASERQARGDAERLSQLKDELIAVLSHELRTPLTAITGWTHVLRQRRDPATLDRALDVIARNTKLQATLISDLLDMSQMNMGKIRLEISEVEPMAIVEAVVSNAQPSAEAKRAEIIVSQTGPCEPIRADPGRMMQILSNLIGNALKFSPSDTPVRVEVGPRDGGLLLSVIDQGQGIDAQFLPLVFDRFSQADSGRSRHRGGLGLGLSIVRHLAEAHGGRVMAHSEGTGRGSRFDVWLPGQAGPAAGADGAGHVDDEERVLEGLHLLVVDDDPEVCAMLQIILGDRGAIVQVAHDAQSALRQLELKPPDVLLSDIGMPGMDGYALITEVRRGEMNGRLPALALTSFTREHDQLQAQAAGFDAHAPKPIQPFQLVHQIKDLARGNKR
ncbi:MAG TPA: response regulator [Rubrivivax sp.]|nr:response regulator [Rubrivivax sp.]